MRKKLLSAALCFTTVATLFAGCGSEKESGNSSEGKVYYLNFKPEVDEQWQAIAKEYTEKTGVKVEVVTAASGQYEATLKSQISGSNAPTLFQINGPIGYMNWKEYTMDLTDTDLYKNLSDKGLAVTGDNGGVYGVPYTVEAYGIIYNDAIMQAYFATEGAKASSVDEINTFAKLQEVVEDMTAKKDSLGIDGVFASTSLMPGEDWRWQTHLANLPVYYEYKDNNVADMAEIQFTYGNQYKNIFDLYINNSTCEPGLLGSKAVTDSMAEFALGKCAMVQNGNWAWGQISSVEGNVVAESDIKFMPIYIGANGEENQGLCTGTENFWCINDKASEADKQATIDFVNWLITSEEGKAHMVNDLGNSAPFSTFTDAEKPSDPLAKEMFRYMENGKSSVTWNFTTFPSQTFKDDFGAALLEYASGNMSWDEVSKLVVEEWASEKSAIGE